MLSQSRTPSPPVGKDTPEIALKAMFTTNYFIAGANLTENVIDVDALVDQLNLTLTGQNIRIVDGFFWNSSISRQYCKEMCPNALLGNILQLNILASLVNRCNLSDTACAREFTDELKTKINDLAEIFVKIPFIDDSSKDMRLKLCALTDMESKNFEDVSIDEAIPTTVVIPMVKEARRKTVRPLLLPILTTTTATKKRRRKSTTTTTVVPVPLIDPFCLLIPGHVTLILTDDGQGTEIRDEIRTNDYDNRRQQQQYTFSFYEDTVNNLCVQLNCPQQDSYNFYDCSRAYYIHGWIDLNNDGVFDEAEKRVYYQSFYNNEMSQSISNLQISVPPIDNMYTKSESVRMQLRLVASDYYKNKCGLSEYSQIREYMINIIPIRRPPGEMELAVSENEIVTMTTTVAPVRAINPMCYVKPASVRSILMSGHHNTEIRDETPANQRPLTISLCENSVNVLSLELDCGGQYRDSSYDDGCRLGYRGDVHIDLNDDGRFDEFENRVLHNSLGEGKKSRGRFGLEVCIPSIDGVDTKSGQHRMRIRVSVGGDYARECGNGDYSEIREYMVNIIPKSMCAAPCPVVSVVRKTFTCPSSPSRIAYVMIGGEQGTQVLDANPSDMIISGYHTRQHTTLIWYGYTLYLMRIQLDCPQIYDRDSLDNDCALSHHVDVWIDLNDDGRFDDSENRVHRRSRIEDETQERGFDLQISVPTIDDINVKRGVHRLRVRLTRSDSYQRECGNTDHSQILEYTVDIIPRRPCSSVGYVTGQQLDSYPDVIVHLTADATGSTLCLPGNLICSAGSSAIRSVKLSGEQNTLIHDETTRCSATNNYQDQHRFSVKMFENKAYTLTIELYCVEPWNNRDSNSHCDLPHSVGVWIDLNNDGQFDENTERLLREDDRNVGYRNGVHDFNLVIPAVNDYNMINVPHTMRVILSRDPYTCRACHNDGYGEARDYVVHIERQPWY